MLARNVNARVVGGARRVAPSAAVRAFAVSRRAVAVRAAVSSESVAWDAWTPFIKERGAAAKVSQESSKFAAIATKISGAAKGYKPQFTFEPHGASFKTQHVEKVKVKELPKDLHDKLETIGVAVLENHLGLSELDYLNASYTTTDIDAALSLTGTIIDKDGDKTAALAFVVTETERPASWSRLEGLILHWACTSGPGAAWNMPPEGWVATPNKSRDAGGAIQCSFEKTNVGQNNEQMYVLVLQVPLRGVLRSGGPVFVLKGTANQTDRWLKDQSTQKDFFLDLGSLPLMSG